MRNCRASHLAGCAKCVLCMLTTLALQVSMGGAGDCARTSAWGSHWDWTRDWSIDW
jgi:hypothetical protein